MNNRFSSELEFDLFTIDQAAANPRWLDWQEYDKGPGIFEIPADQYLGIRAQWIDDSQIRQLVNDMKDVDCLRYLYLAENRRITNSGMLALADLPQLRYLNISACDISNDGLAFLLKLPKLEYLNISYCNRITERAAMYFRNLRKLSYLDIQGVIKINTGGMKKFEQPGLTIHKQ